MPQLEDPPQQVGVIAFRVDAGKLDICVTYKPRNGAWGIPKGFVDPGESPPESALKEAHEESGLRGTLIGEPIGAYDYSKWGTTFTVAVYVMEVTDQDEHWEDELFRERHWLEPNDALRRLQAHPVLPLLKRAVTMLNNRHDLT
jgi:8-oxo-dGTP pyrophosphatase MutT (NUDIX family)